MCESPSKLRNLFVIIIIFCNPTDPLHLWNTFKQELSDDIRYSLQQQTESSLDFNEEIFNLSLLNIEEKVGSICNGKKLHDYGLPTPMGIYSSHTINQEYFQATNFDLKKMQEVIEYSEPKLNNEQKEVYNTVLNDVHTNGGTTYYLDAPGGTGMLHR